MKALLCGSLVFGSLVAASTAMAAVDPAAAVVQVRKTCTENGVTLDNCFTTMGQLTSWMSGTRRPNAASPLKVEIGPGKFDEDVFITCNTANNYTGHTSFEGSGSNQTILNGFGGGSHSPLTVSRCTELSFSHLKVTTRFYGGVLWKGGGNSRWNDVEVAGTARAWYEEDCAETRGSHYWFGSRLSQSSKFGIADTYRATCDETWLFGSEVVASVPATEYQASGAAVIAGGAGIIHVYGSVLRSLIEGPQTGTGVPAASVGTVGAGGEIHIHGTGIDVISNSGKNITALYASNSGSIHANEAAYNLKTTGTVTRINNQGGHVHAPYVWHNHPDAPVITSDHGADTAVVTNTQDGQPHLVIYSTACASKWFDTTAGACR